MSKLPSCRLLMERKPQSGPWNMAVDEMLLNTAAANGLATFRWYRWREPTLSLGYFQHADDIAGEPKWRGIPVVRRLTGGGAILHHHEWTYSFAVPASQSLVRHPEELYDLVHAEIMAMLKRNGVSLAPRGVTVKQSPEPLLCFSRRDSHDMVRNQHKILGSAQRRRRGAILQHGSLLLKASPLTPDHWGLLDLGWTRELTTNDLSGVAEKFAEEIQPAEFTDRETAEIREIIHRHTPS